SVAVGDVNGDGRSDLIMGCSEDTGSDAGNMIVYTRNAANTGFDAAVELANPTPVAGDGCGASVTTGDINADGRADLIMGCIGDDGGAGDAGNMIVYTRNAANTGFDTATELANPTPV
ncbi:MAG: VCBS repeat-containing protein, partial [Thermoleophilia bacterium]|nr:VCBS repeat-containing protein [Thermoleophilia bacterium]